MLYDKRWDKQSETKANPFTLGNLIAWLEQQPADNEYTALPESTCLLGQFAAAMGAKDPHGASIKLGNSIFAEIAFPNGGDCTFGAALERARAIASR